MSLDHYYRINLRFVGGPLNGLVKEFEINQTPGELIRVGVVGNAETAYVLLEGSIVQGAMVGDWTAKMGCGNALHVPMLPPSISRMLN